LCTPFSISPAVEATPNAADEPVPKDPAPTLLDTPDGSPLACASAASANIWLKMPFALTADRERQLETILPRYPTKMAACIAALHLCQDQQGYIDDLAMTYVAHRLDVPPAHIQGVVTFYTLFNQKPVGKHQVWVCRTLPCALRGSLDVVKHCEERLGIHVGETTPDGKVTLRTAECLASCGTAPMMQVDKEYFENLTFEKVDEILDRLKKH
jgi:NADH-quinone oxidoreductase subunit E